MIARAAGPTEVSPTVVSETGWLARLSANRITSGVVSALAVVMAARRVPTPLSARLVTVMVAGVSRVSSRSTESLAGRERVMDAFRGGGPVSPRPDG